MIRQLVVIGTTIAVILVAGAGAAWAADHTVDGTLKTQVTLQITSADTCNPAAPTQPSDYLCRYLTKGKYTEGGYLAHGRIRTRQIYDYQTLAYNSTYRSKCLQVSGTFKFKNSSGTLRTTILAANSVACQESGGRGVWDEHLALGFTGGSYGAYGNVTGVDVQVDSTWTPGSLSGTYDERAQFAGNITSS